MTYYYAVAKRTPPAVVTCERDGCDGTAVSCRETVWLCKEHLRQYYVQYERERREARKRRRERLIAEFIGTKAMVNL